jgi:thioredoxin-related protein
VRAVCEAGQSAEVGVVKKFRLRLLLAGAAAFLALACHQKKPVESIVADKFEWLTDFKRAQEAAKATHKALLIDFTGSDWCPPCQQLQKEVFATAEFQNYAAKNFILLEVDFPRAKEQTREVATQNMELAQKFGVQGFPYILLLDSDGVKLGDRVGYDPGGGPAGFIAWLEKQRKG